jgi:hypothetical protein
MNTWDGKERRRGGAWEERRARIEHLQRQWEAEQAPAKAPRRAQADRATSERKPRQRTHTTSSQADKLCVSAADPNVEDLILYRREC